MFHKIQHKILDIGFRSTTSVYDEYVDVALPLVKEAGAIMAQKFKIYDTRDKHNIDSVAKLGRELEEFIKGGLMAAFPRHTIIGKDPIDLNELQKKSKKCDGPTWFINSIDGTLNFIHGLPQSCISLGFAVDKEPLIGIIYNPMMEQLFTATKDMGAFLNEEEINVSTAKKLKSSLVAFDYCSQDKNTVFENFNKVMTTAHGIRNLGSPSLNMAMVAMGGCDAAFEFEACYGDICAGAAIVKAAGGVVMDPSGRTLDIFSHKIVCAATRELAEDLVQNLVLSEVNTETASTAKLDQEQRKQNSQVVCEENVVQYSKVVQNFVRKNSDLVQNFVERTKPKDVELTSVPENNFEKN